MNKTKPNSVSDTETGANLNNSQLKTKWETFDWKKAEEVVNRLQTRIAKATIDNNINLAKKLGYLLVNNYYAKALAVRKVVTNTGHRTAGVDNILWESPEKKMKAIYELNQTPYYPSALKRTYIEKSNGKKRPLGIPTMYDRAMQALYALALDPIAESTSDELSYGFRKFRSAHDAREQIFADLCKRNCAEWILEGDIKGCFDNINHDWLIENIPMDKGILRKFLKAGFIYKDTLYETDEGTPQGGIISPILANMTLDGIEELIKRNFWANTKGNISYKYNKRKVNFVRYADDFIVTADTRETAEEVRELIKNFLVERGLELSPEKTLITHINDGFDFLGWNFRKYNGKLLIKPNRKSINGVLNRIRALISRNKATSQDELIKKLNPIIRGWANYHQGAVSKDIFSDIDNEIHQALWNWAIRRHGKQSLGKVKDKYWKTINGRQWVFCTEVTRLIKLSDTMIVRHPKLMLGKNPYTKEGLEYHKERQMKIGARKITGKYKKVWIRQYGLCCYCGNTLEPNGDKELIHIIPKSDGGSDEITNLAYCHSFCKERAKRSQ